jgi:hypothetical protein
VANPSTTTRQPLTHELTSKTKNWQIINLNKSRISPSLVWNPPTYCKSWKKLCLPTNHS